MQNVVKVALAQEESPELHPPSLRTIVDAHGPFVCRSLRILGVLDSDLDDMVQEVFIVVHQLLQAYEERGHARAWLYSICKRVARQERRKLMRWRREVTGDLPEVPADATQLDRLDRSQTLAIGHRMLARLTPEQREVFWLYEVEDLPVPSIAKALGWPVQTAYYRLHKARQLILAEVERAAATGDERGER